MKNSTPSTARERILKMLTAAANGKQIDQAELMRLAAAIENDTKDAEQRIADSEAAARKAAMEARRAFEIIPPSIPDRRTALDLAANRKEVKVVDPEAMSRMKFEDAALAWYEANKTRWKRRTAYGNRAYIKALDKFFRGTKLSAIHIGHLLAYQEERTGNPNGRWKKKSGPSNVNHETNTLSQILAMAGLWAPLDNLFSPLPDGGFKKPKVMDEDEKRRFYAVAASRPEWSLALWVATITNNTSASGTELRNLTLADVVLGPGKPRIVVNAATAKCRVRGRSIRLNGPALDAIQKCLERAKACGSVRPEHYVFPKRKGRGLWDPTQPASDSWLNRPWRELREAAGLPWLTPHCLRHQCITELGEAGAAPEVIRNIAGHVSEEMMRHYTSIRQDQQAAALDLLEPDTHVAPSRRGVAAKTAAPHTCPHCGVVCSAGLAFCPNGDVLDEEKARKARPWLFQKEAA